jgi:hypothetical protein
MLLKHRYEKKDEIPVEYLGLFTEQDGAWVLTGISGIKTQDDVDRLTDSLRKEREDHGEVKKKLRKFNDLEPDDVFAKLDRITELEAAAANKIDDTKLNEMVETRIKSRTAPLERQIKELTDDSVRLTGEVDTYKGKETKRTIHDQIRKAAVQAKLRDTAVDDALMIGENVFELDDRGRAVTKDGVGITPGLAPDVWFTENTKVRPHWWPESQGAGAKGGNGSDGANNPFSAENWNMTEQGQLFKADPEKATQFAKSAGTTIGGGKPARK